MICYAMHMVFHFNSYKVVFEHAQEMVRNLTGNDIIK